MSHPVLSTINWHTGFRMYILKWYRRLAARTKSLDGALSTKTNTNPSPNCNCNPKILQFLPENILVHKKKINK